MEEIKCIYYRTVENMIFVKAQSLVKCPGVGIELIPYTPLVLKGEFTTSSIFKIEEIKLNTDDTEALVKLLSRRNFPKVGESRAKRIIQVLRYVAADNKLSNFSELPYEVMEKELTNLHLPDVTVEKISLLFTGLSARAKLYSEIKKYGGSFADADRLYAKYHTGALDSLKEDPYKGVECGLPLHVCDALADNNNISAARFDAIGKILIADIESHGDCCITIEKAKKQIINLQKRSVVKPVSSLTVLTHLLSTHQIILRPSQQYGYLIYPIKMYRLEQEIASELYRLNADPVTTGFIEYSGNWAPDPDQLRAIYLVRTSGVKIVTGGPGTGKTSVIHEIIREYKKHSSTHQIMLCAPTGAAAARINQSINGQFHATTIHKLLDIRPFGIDDYRCMRNRTSPLPVGLYVIDEMSMVGEELFAQLLRAIPTGSTVILSGDIDQLQSVTSGTVLKDLINAEVFETVRLTTVHRQQDDSSIVTNYLHLKQMDGILETAPNFTIDISEDANERLIKIAQYYTKYKGHCQILTFTRQGRLGKNKIDDLITSARIQGNTEYKHTGFYLGDKVMMTHNNYKTGYFNGDAGVITRINHDSINVQFFDGLLELKDDNLLDMEHSWACTVHKSQGNEYDNVIIVIDDEYKSMLYRSILLTAITRARKNVHIVSTTQALNTCLISNNEDLRITGLADILRAKEAANE